MHFFAFFLFHSLVLGVLCSNFAAKIRNKSLYIEYYVQRCNISHIFR